VRYIIFKVKHTNKLPIINGHIHITEKSPIDESVEEYELHSYEPFAGTNLNNPGEIRINI